MKIGIDGNEANVKVKVGIGEFAYELLEQFAANDIENNYSVYLKDKPNQDFPRRDDQWHIKTFGPRSLWTQIALPVHLYFERSKPDVFFTPSHYAPRFSPVPTVISVMDVSYLHFPELFNKNDLYQLTNWTKYSVKKAAKVLTISQASKNDIIKAYDIPESRVVVIYPGIKTLETLSTRIYTMDRLQKQFNISEKYLLFVGTLQPRKNIERLIEAFAEVIKENDFSEYQLVVVGKKGWQYEPILNAPEKYNVSEKVKFLDFVSNEDLQELYYNATAFVWPSLYEGFGLPVLEAMQAGVPVITSNVSSLPEAGGDAALYVDPKDVSDIAEKIKKLLGSEKLRKEMIVKGKEHVKQFSWEKSARKVLETLQEVVQKS